MFFHWQSGQHQHLLKAKGPDVVRMIAHPSQINQIERYVSQDVAVELCSKSLIKADDNTTASDVIEQMSKISASPDKGGFIPASKSYRASLIAGTYGNQEPDPVYFSTIRDHPFVRKGGLFCFNDGVHPALVLLLNYIYDIRRFVNAESGKSELLSYFQLDDIGAFTELIIENQATDRTLRVAMAYNATGLRNPAYLPEGDPREFFRRDAEVLFRQLYMVEGKDTKESEIMAHYRATAKFMLYVEKLWTSGLGLSNFYPASFFKDTAVAKAYKASLK